MWLVVDAIDGLGPGQIVVVAIDRSVSFASVFFLFGLPLAGLIAGALIGHSFPVFGIAPDAWKDKDTEVYIYSAQVFGDKAE